jgi:hypothetical protein
MRKRPLLTLFLIVQLVGISCLALWPHAPSSVSMPMWGTALIALFPGNFIGGFLAEKLFWQKGLSLSGLSVLAMLLQFLINAAIWFAVVKGVKVLYGYFSRRSSVVGVNAAK